MALITLFVLPGSGTAWWFWMLILAAFYGMSTGVTEIVKAKTNRPIGHSASAEPTLPASTVERELRASETNEIMTPLSITEFTTKKLKETGSRSHQSRKKVPRRPQQWLNGLLNLDILQRSFVHGT
jgi:hypothetical protein